MDEARKVASVEDMGLDPGAAKGFKIAEGRAGVEGIARQFRRFMLTINH